MVENTKLQQYLDVLAATLDGLRNEGYDWYVNDYDFDITDRSYRPKHIATVSKDEHGETVVTYAE